MLLGDITNLNPAEAQYIAERKAQTAYPRASFQYANYETDPRPDVLVLGRYKAETGNNLIGGINLNYLSNAQQERLRGQLKRIYSRDKLRSRYRALKKLLPDVAQYYRTYNPEHARGVEMDTFMAQANKLNKAGKVEPTEKPKKIKDPAQSAWQLKRRLYDPDTGYRTKPEHDKEDPETTKEKRRRYRIQRKELDDLEYKAALARAEEEAEEIPLEPEANLEPDDINLELDKFSSVIDDEPIEEPIMVEPEPEEAKEESRDYRYVPNMGYVWSDSNSYITWHKLPRFTSLSESEGRTLVIYDLITEQLIVDKAFDHSLMLAEAGWEYDHTVRFEIIDNKLRLQCNSDDVDLQQVLEAFVRSDYYELLVANNQN